MNETKNGIQTTVEAEKAGVSFIDLGAATISFNLREDCGFLQMMFIGDDTCNDNLNIEKCHYDHGDCCLNEISDDQCTECICHEDGTRHPSRFETTTEEPNPCPDYHYIGDGICDDSTNNEVCNFDGNDCCIDEAVDYFCSDCICHFSPILDVNNCVIPHGFDAAGNCIDENGMLWLSAVVYE